MNNAILTPCANPITLHVFHIALANVTCALNTHNMADNTILVVVSDNGGYKTMTGNNYPLKGTTFRIRALHLH